MSIENMFKHDKRWRKQDPVYPQKRAMPEQTRITAKPVSQRDTLRVKKLAKEPDADASKGILTEKRLFEEERKEDASKGHPSDTDKIFDTLEEIRKELADIRRSVNRLIEGKCLGAEGVEAMKKLAQLKDMKHRAYEKSKKRRR